ncbi:zinc finger protein 91-like [Lucilia cuprina]|uniref:zinc finger protein 91-like n=1 Tax=Lucilia cuprina TaxID=7375 RepID=UPI001F06CD6F|nr:zinc finger protein 91-like [Lucilia cuprina]
MSLDTLCRLCVCPFHDCKQLFDENGQCNEAYDIATKYFDPMLLNSEQELNSAVICLECWQHISDFYNFQQTVYTAQSKLEDVKQIVPLIKLEEELIEETPMDSGELQNDVLLNDEELKDEDRISDVEDTYDVRDDNPFSSDDERPLLESVRKVSKKKTKRNKKEESGDNTYKSKTPPKKKEKRIKKENKSKTKSKAGDSEIKAEEASEDPNDSANNNEQSGSQNENSTSTDKISYNKQRTLENDAYIAAWRSELECEICHASFSNYTLLRKHFVQEHPGEKFYVLCCQRKFTHRFHIVEHIRLHMDPNAFKCEICGRCSTNSRNLTKHIRELHTEEGKLRPFECNVCHKSFINKTVLRIHMETHETNLTHMCRECGKGFPSEQRRNLHEKSVHNADRICDQCGKTLHGPYALKKHLLEHAGVQKRKWPCDICGAELHSHSSLKRHKLITHHDGSTVYVCSECGKVATTEMALRSHKKNVHQTERKFKCTICEKSFKFAIVLREHMATHTGEDLYQCPHCTKTFKTNANMHHHRKKAHPKEWAEARMNKPQSTKVDFNLVQNEVVGGVLSTHILRVFGGTPPNNTVCRLCLGAFQDDCQQLIDDTGQCNDAYDIASKYFDPMMLIADQEHSSPIICAICWRHIQDFYYFQQTVFEAHAKLEDVKEIALDVKVELEQIDDKQTKADGSSSEKYVKHELDGNRIESFDIEDDNVFSSDDERPLMKSSNLVKEKCSAIQNSKEIVSLNKSKTPKKHDKRRKKKKLETTEKHLKRETSTLLDEDDACNNSEKTDAQQKTLENDAFIAAWRSELECVKCNATFANFTLLRKHFLKDHLEEKCYIICCDRKFSSRYHIVEHIRLHMDPNAYRCDVCGRCSTNSRNLAKHIKELHSEEGERRGLECPTCLKILANKNSLRVHLETHETNLNYICRECGKGFPSEQKRTLHERYVHNASLICDQCGKTLHNHYAMKQHLLQHAGVQKRKWPCDLCSVELNSRSGLKRHKQLIHQDGSTVYVCSECGKVASSEIALLTHKRNVHISGRKHKCTLCEKAFKFPRVLREHMATHTGEDLYKCPHCERTFKTNANMHHHRKKAHPKEWAEGRLNKPQVTKVDFNLVQNEVVIMRTGNIVQFIKVEFFSSYKHLLFDKLFIIMNQTALCRLCIRLYNEFINLFNDNGESNEAYDIAVKYFDPMLLKPQHEHDTTLICIVCWSHINNFHNFQNSVLNAQVQLENNIEHIPMIKLEDEAWMDQITIVDNENNTLTNTTHSYVYGKENENQEVASSSRNYECKPNMDKTQEYEMLIKKWKGVLECEICHYKFNNFSDLRQHFQKQHPKDKLYIKCCKRKFYNRYDMVEHIRVHLNQNTYQCNICNKTFSCNRNLNRHIRQVHIEKVQQVFELINNTNKSEKYHPPMGLLKAEEENKTNNKKPFTRSTKVPRGKINITPQTDEKIAGNLEVKKTRRHHQDLKYFQLKISSNKKTPLEYDTQIAELKSVLECPVCQRNFPYYTTLREHFQTDHPEAKFHIMCCQRKFGNSYQIYEHFQLHNNPNAFRCEICEHTFSRSASLTRHIRELHMQNVQWSCDHCGVSFKSCSVLGRHKKRCLGKICKKLQPQHKVECLNVTDNYVGATFSNYTLLQIAP